MILKQGLAVLHEFKAKTFELLTSLNLENSSSNFLTIGPVPIHPDFKILTTFLISSFVILGYQRLKSHFSFLVNNILFLLIFLKIFAVR